MMLLSSATKGRDLLVVSELENHFIERVLVVGGSGFIASGLINYLQNINFSMKSKLQVRIISRFREHYPINFENTNMFCHPKIEQLCEFYQKFDPQIVFYISRINSESIYEDLLNDNLELLKYHLEAATTLNSAPRFVFLSSGAVYGLKQVDKDQIPLTENLDINLETLSIYGKIKLYSEELILHYCEDKKLDAKILRLFAFFGPGLPLENFAIGNFMLSALHHKNIKIQGTGKTIRSYMYIDDLSSTLIRLALKDVNIVNVGGETSINLVELATIFHKNFGISLEILAKENFESYYVPDLNKVKNLLGEVNYVSLETGLKYWHKSLINGSQI